tara:strand:+ start:680 stop:919 length:240 start_codon:yes stop_codon:yes gene_type:complete
MKITKQQLKQIIKEELTMVEQFADENAGFSIDDLGDIPEQLNRVLTIMKEGDHDAAYRRVRDIRLVIQSIIDSLAAKGQ